MGYLCYHIPSSRVYISRNVIFYETIFPFQTPSHAAPVPVSSTHTSLPLSLSISPPTVPTPSIPSDINPETSPCPEPIATSLLPLDITLASCTSIPPLPRYRVRSRRPKVYTYGIVPWPPPRSHATTVDTVPLEPTLVTKALKHADWRQAMQAEFHALLQTQTW